MECIHLHQHARHVILFFCFQQFLINTFNHLHLDKKHTDLFDQVIRYINLVLKNLKYRSNQSFLGKLKGHFSLIRD